MVPCGSASPTVCSGGCNRSGPADEDLDPLPKFCSQLIGLHSMEVTSHNSNAVGGSRGVDMDGC
jgi:hypothetical protein